MTAASVSASSCAPRTVEAISAPLSAYAGATSDITAELTTGPVRSPSRCSKGRLAGDAARGGRRWSGHALSGEAGRAGQMPWRGQRRRRPPAHRSRRRASVRDHRASRGRASRARSTPGGKRSASCAGSICIPDAGTEGVPRAKVRSSRSTKTREDCCSSSPSTPARNGFQHRGAEAAVDAGVVQHGSVRNISASP